MGFALVGYSSKGVAGNYPSRLWAATAFFRPCRDSCRIVARPPPPVSRLRAGDGTHPLFLGGAVWLWRGGGAPGRGPVVPLCHGLALACMRRQPLGPNGPQGAKIICAPGAAGPLAGSLKQLVGRQAWISTQAQARARVERST